MPKILMIEDDLQQSGMLSDYLSAEQMDVVTCANGNDGLSRLQRESFDALILDVGLPDMDGFEVCRRLRAFSALPVLMLTARGDEMDRIIGLEIGADDYLPKPFNPRELLARLRAILRRAQHSSNSAALHFGRLEIHEDAHSASLDGQTINLTAYQFDLLSILARHAGRVMSRDQIMDELKGHDLDSFDRSIDVHISRIRSHIEDDPKKPRRILTIRGTGYVFARQQD
ncbi:two-component system, OmpR family, alkaline phosphatase synthesis response regulator PhoP [Mariprofundus micogutta]|uniref:Two-component system, OmpR family, alkaline phosphatase synthesis response regulator PhoP n=1 Tax=Mariprofundus micogutta TaxID=1921010 RepID=A0A1L8CJV6_9PROT|nr:response regulator transcription factor [Mariprofundus micogutta]GAV19165.1 two-component system, OmpR family, alkaline phosphatase synthesis response regulator PhoP [Mariprofundus micogutta]